MILHFLRNYPSIAYYTSYAAVFALLSALEYFWPRRIPTTSRLFRWPPNLSLFIINMILLQSLSTLTTADLAYLAWKNGWGLLNQFNLPTLSLLFLSLLLLDLEAFALHFIYHKIPWGWRFHRVHHTDLDLDATSGLRFHPLESLVTFLVRQPFILLAGPSPLAVFVFDSLIVLSSFLTHANIRLWPAFDRILRWFFVTPDMHRIHHSADWGESNSNFGVSLSWWDRLFMTYRSQPKVAAEKLPLGIQEFPSQSQLGLTSLLVMPFLKRNR